MAFFKKKEKKEEQPKLTPSQKIFRNFKDYLYMLAGFMLAFLLLFRIVEVDGSSMYETLHNGDRLLLLSRSVYRTPKCGDIVVVSKESFRNGRQIVKRVIATQGQTVDIDFEKRIVYVDGEALEESYVYFSEYATALKQGDIQFPLTVDDGCVFVMGDNRNDSLDSRYSEIGQIDCREILGKVVFLLIPGGEGADWSRIGVMRS